ncbi:Thiolase [Niveomyces insectorum RCEF 264]|uniref:Thiolase n=1 Tax=Niveomyces insectorum RCEF 264 TaxID=1081102 RepID=A0A167T679_9HYPO|nr:Thiolase [Niveomyces insectorum RCEF 264]
MIMAVPQTTPIVVGVGEIRDKSIDLSHPNEPADLMVEAIRRSFADASLTMTELAAAPDSISVVPPWTWAYPDLPGLLAERLHIQPRHRVLGSHGGDQPALLFGEAAQRIARGESKLAIVTGGEALATLAACQKAKKLPPPGWTAPDPNVKPISTSDLSFNGQNIASKHSMGLAIHVYPMYENGFRAHEKQTQQQNQQESAELYAAFDQIACTHPYSWRHGETPRDAKAIGTVTAKNRMICTPYPLLQNAFNTVNLAAACLLTSVEHAEKLGIPQDRWIYVLGGAGTNDKENFWERPNFYSSQSLQQSLDAAVAVSGISREDIDCYDFYSCFPIVPKLACKHLGLSVTKPAKAISLLGGLTSFGGAGNNYSMHALTEMTRKLRDKTYRTGLVLANGGVLTHHYALCLSSASRRDFSAYQRQNPLPTHLQHSQVVQVDDQVQGSATIETYTVEFDRQGRPRQANIVGRLDANGHRFVANHGDDATLVMLTDPILEPVGLRGIVHQSQDGRNVFYVGAASKL